MSFWLTLWQWSWFDLLLCWSLLHCSFYRMWHSWGEKVLIETFVDVPLLKHVKTLFIYHSKTHWKSLFLCRSVQTKTGCTGSRLTKNNRTMVNQKKKVYVTGKSQHSQCYAQSDISAQDCQRWWWIPTSRLHCLQEKKDESPIPTFLCGETITSVWSF